MGVPGDDSGAQLSAITGRWRSARALLDLLAVGLPVAAIAAGCDVDSRNVGVGNNLVQPFGNLGGSPGQGGASVTIYGVGGQSPNSESGAGGGAQVGVDGMVPGGSSGTAGGSGADATGIGGMGGGANPSAMGGSGGGTIGGTGVALLPVDGWVDTATNGLGIQGSFFVGTDAEGGGSSTVSPQNFAAAGSEICVQGVGSQVGVDQYGVTAYARDWGAIVGLILSQDVQNGAVNGWSPSTPSGLLAGFSFVITGPVIPPLLRFTVVNADSTLFYCTPAAEPSGSLQSYRLDDLETECWFPGMGVAASQSDTFSHIEWTIPTTTEAPTPFNFCVSDVQGILE